VPSPDERDAQRWLEVAKCGNFAEAWTISDRILARHRASPDFSRPRHQQSVWTGEPLDGARVLVRCYHGLGDTIQFIRYVPQLRAIAREVILWVQPQLIRLLEGLPGIDRLVALHDGSPDIAYDVDVEIMELPFVFRSTLGTIPRRVPYLDAAPAPLPDGRPRVGVVWRAGDWETQRSMPFDAIRGLFDVSTVSWFSLQQRRRPDERHPSLADIAHDDLLEVARRVKALDLLITVDSMPAHLAGALAVPVWTLLVHDADWRWMRDRTDSPWYPTMRLFRQSQAGGWANLVQHVQETLSSRTYF
jgi:hypothetical protein